MRLSLLICITCFSISTIDAQVWQHLLTEEDSYQDVVRKIESYYETHDRKGLDYKHFQRWNEYVRHRMGPDGNVVNISAINYKEYQHLQRDISQGRSTHGSWDEVGPFNYTANDVWSSGGLGRINCMAFHPTNDLIMWVGTAGGGMWKTTNGGSTWFPMTDGFASISITDIVVDQTNTNIIYILTGDSEAALPFAGTPGPASVGAFKTTDGGTTWTQSGLVAGVNQNIYPCKMIGHPTNPNILFAVYKNIGIYRTVNGGGTWTQVESGKTVWDIEFTPGLPDAMIAASSSGILRSINGGLTWVIDDDPVLPTSFSRAEIAMSPSAPQNVYVVYGGGPAVGGTFQGLYKSDDYGATFDLMSNTPNILGSALDGGSAGDQAWYDLSIVVDPNNDARIFVGGVNCWKSVNSGVTWSRETWNTKNFEPIDPYVHADWHDMYFRGNRLYANVDGGIYYTDDYGNDWTEISAGLSIMQFYEIDILNNEYIGGTQDNGTNGGSVNGTSVTQLWGGDGFGAVWHTGDNSIQYISTQDAIYRRQFGTSIPISPIEVGNGDHWHTEIEMHTTNPDYVFVTSDGGSGLREIFRGNGNAIEFDWVDLGLSEVADCRIENFVQGIDNDEILYVASCELVFRTANLEAAEPTWLPLNLPFYSDGNPRDVEVDPANANEIWVAVSGYHSGDKVWYSTNGGSNWTNVSGTLPNVVMNCLVYAPGTNNGIYVGSDIGVFYRDATMSDWVYFSNYLPNVEVQDMKVSGGYLYVGTHGRGLWRSPTYTACPVNLTLTPGNDLSNPYTTGAQVYHASNSIISTRIIQGGNGTNVQYNAGNYIDITPGFWAKAENIMEMKIDGCPD